MQELNEGISLSHIGVADSKALMKLLKVAQLIISSQPEIKDRYPDLTEGVHLSSLALLTFIIGTDYFQRCLVPRSSVHSEDR